MLSGRSEIALSEQGRAEAARLAAYLADRPIAAAYASPRRRAIETAEIAVAGPVQIADALDEIDFGAFAGRSFAALGDDTAWQHWNEARHIARCPGGETMAEAVARAEEFLNGAAEDAATILCVSHCDIIRGLVAAVLGLGFDRMFAFDCDPASLTTLQRDGGWWRLAGLNWHAC